MDRRHSNNVLRENKYDSLMPLILAVIIVTPSGYMKARARAGSIFAQYQKRDKIVGGHNVKPLL